jgi:hypothetical protein
MQVLWRLPQAATQAPPTAGLLRCRHTWLNEINESFKKVPEYSDGACRRFAGRRFARVHCAEPRGATSGHPVSKPGITHQQ